MGKSKNIYDICHKVKQNQKINFLSFAITPWHALGVMGAMEVLKKKGCQLEGSICICAHATGGFLLDKSFFSAVESENIEVLYFRGGGSVDKGKMLRFLKSVSGRKGNEFFIVSPLKPHYDVIEQIGAIRKQDCIKAVVVDEGLATYMRDKQSWIHIQNREENKQGFQFEELLQKMFLDNYYQRSFQKHKILLNQNIFRYDRNQNLLLNSKSIYGYRRILKKMSHDNEIPNAKDYENAVVINTQPYFEEGRLLNNADIKVLEKVCNVFTKQGMNIVLKVHPREDQLERYQKLPCKIDTSGGVPMELLLSSLPVKPKYLVGFTTTTLVTGKLLFGIEGISLAKFIKQDDMEKELWKEFGKFRQLFRRYLILPANYTELERAVEKLKSK